MSRMIIVMGLCVLLIACSTFNSSNDMEALNETPTQKGVHYLLGRGVAQNNEKAFYYFHQAADQGDPYAQNEVAYMYAAGKGTQRNFLNALSYYKKAARHGLATAQYSLGMMYEHGLGIPRNRQLALHWFKKSADVGFEPARLALAHYRA